MDVGVWLRGLGLGKYEEKFRDNAIEADVLPQLTADDLKDIGISAVGDRRRLLAAIAALAGPRFSTVPPELETKNFEVSAERRPVAVMFCDLVDSTSLATRLDPEDWRNLVTAYLDEASNAVTSFGGHVLKRLGDGLMALFGYPEAQENDAERAVRAALAIQRALAELNARNERADVPELFARIGIDAGPVVVDEAGEVFGDAPNIASRAQGAAEPGIVLITARVQRLVAGLFVAEDKGAHSLKGAPEPIGLYRIVRASGAGRRVGGRTLTSFIGREEDLASLLRRWERTRAGDGQFVQIVGEPGLGKSRLVKEFHARLGETPHTWVEWSSSQLLQNTPLHPVTEWGRARFGRPEVPAEARLADLEATLAQVKLDPQKTAALLAPLFDIPLPTGRAPDLLPEELRRRQLGAMVALILAGARSQPVVLAFEDLHWADPTSRDLMRALAERGGQAPLLVVATARPEFRAPWTTRSHHGVIALAPLDRAQVAQMVGEIASRHALPPDIVDRVGERTGGVPLFVEEVTRLLLEAGAPSGAHAIPPTLHQSLAARLDRLGEAREVAQIAAVLGRDFSFRLLRDVAGLEETALDPALERLAEADLVFVEGVPPDATYRFKHALIRDAAYDSLLKSRRQTLHRHAAEALIKGGAEPEAIANHLTEAGDDLAIEWWGKAGDQAIHRSAFQEAITHLGKAIEMADRAGGESARQRANDALLAVLPETEKVKAAIVQRERRLRLQTAYSHAMIWSKGYAAEETKVALARVSELAARTPELPKRSDFLADQFASRSSGGELRAARELALTLLREAEHAGRDGEASIATWWLGLVAYWRGDFDEARTHYDRAINARDLNPDFSSYWQGLGDLKTWISSSFAATLWQVGQVERARQAVDWATRRASEAGNGPAMADALFWKSYLEVWRHDPLATLTAAEALEAVARQHGMSQYLNEAELHSGWARGRIGDPVTGAAQVQRVLASLTDQGVRINLGFYNGLLAQLEAETLGAETALARIDEAFRLSDQVEHHCSLPFLHRLRGEFLLRRDPADRAPAEEAFGTSIAIAKEQGARSPVLLASLSLARLHQSTGRPAEANAVLAPALEGFTSTPEMPEIAAGQALLEALANDQPTEG